MSLHVDNNTAARLYVIKQHCAFFNLEFLAYNLVLESIVASSIHYAKYDCGPDSLCILDVWSMSSTLDLELML